MFAIFIHHSTTLAFPNNVPHCWIQCTINSPRANYVEQKHVYERVFHLSAYKELFACLFIHKKIKSSPFFSGHYWRAGWKVRFIPTVDEYKIIGGALIQHALTEMGEQVFHIYHKYLWSEMNPCKVMWLQYYDYLKRMVVYVLWVPWEYS